MGALVLLPLAWREAGQGLPGQAGSLALLLKVALLVKVATKLLQFGYGQTTITNAGFLANTAAVLTPIIALGFFRQRPPAMIWVASLTTLFGVFNMAGGSWTGVSYGDGLCLGAALAFAVWTLFVGQHVTRYRRPMQLTVIQVAVCGGMCVALG